MATDIFSREGSIGAPFSADESALIFNNGNQDLLVQQVQITYQQSITRLWELGSNKQYFVGGARQGTLNIARVVGPRPILATFMEQYGDVCKVQNNNITFALKAGCDINNPGRIRASGVVITQVAYTIRAQDMVINESMDAMLAQVEST
jgi:hypothetical protein